MITSNWQGISIFKKIYFQNTAHIAFPCFILLFFLTSGCTHVKPVAETQLSPSNQVIIDYRREGGILPLTEEWKIFLGGKLRDVNEKTYMLDKQSYLALLQSCKRIENDYSSHPSRTCADCFTVRLQLNCNEREKTIFVQEGLSGTPVLITELLTTLRRTISNRKSVQ